jgi:hypothetical protein
MTTKGTARDTAPKSRRPKRKLTVEKQTVRDLNPTDGTRVKGGRIAKPIETNAVISCLC